MNKTNWMLVTALVVLPMLYMSNKWWGSEKDTHTSESLTAQVVSEPMKISINESGALEPKDQIVIVNKVRGKTTILHLIPEGSKVKKGDLLVRLDSSLLEDKHLEQKIRTQNAEAIFIRSKVNLEVQESQAKSEVFLAEQEHVFAKEDLENYIEGEYPDQLKQKESKIVLAREVLERANAKLKWSDVLYQQKYISKTELQADQLAANRSKLELELAINALNLLKAHTHKRSLARFKNKVEQTAMILERTKRKKEADLIQHQAELKAKKSEYNRQKEKLKNIEEEISNTTIVAPESGLVVYATSSRASWRGNTDPLYEGQTVRERQELIYLPTNEGMVAQVNIHEAQLRLVQPGMGVRIRVEAIPEKEFSGKVEKIALMPDAISKWLNPDLKLYSTRILLDEYSSVFKTGMNCQAEIIVEELNKALQIPLQAVVKSEGSYYVFVESGEGSIRKEVEVGLDNGRRIHIKKGLAVGETVSLVPPFVKVEKNKRHVKKKNKKLVGQHKLEKA